MAGTIRAKHVAYLDGLRGVAILMVVMVHSSLAVGGLPRPFANLAFYGVRGVQLFFIVSGFTLLMSHQGRPLMPVNFFARRFFRIAPMFYLGAALYLLLSVATSMALPTRAATLQDVIVTLLFVHGWFPTAVNTVVPGGWSIAAEVMFYLTFPMILFAASRPRLMVAITASSYVLAGLANLVLRRFGGPAGEALAFPFWLVQWPAFTSGCWLATLPDQKRHGLISWIAPWLFGSAVIGMAIDSQLAGRSNLLVAIVLLTLLVWSARSWQPGWLAANPLTSLGRVSFSVYILHFAVLGVLSWAVPIVLPVFGSIATFLLIMVSCLGVTRPIAGLTFRFIEQPIITATRHLGQPRTR